MNLKRKLYWTAFGMGLPFKPVHLIINIIAYVIAVPLTLYRLSSTVYKSIRQRRVMK